MSNIAFHSLSDSTVRVSGRERFRFAHFATQRLRESLGIADRLADRPSTEQAQRVASLLKNVPDYLGALGHEHYARDLAMLLAMGFEAAFDLGEGCAEPIPAWLCGLNTLIAEGSDPMILAARLHGQCEVHCYVEGKNRAWLAEIVDRGVGAGIYGAPWGYDGWPALAAHLRARDDEPVVTSYSVTEGFPNAGVAERGHLWTPDPDADGKDWYALPDDEQWRLCMTALRVGASYLELRPDLWRWPDYYFTMPINGWQVNEVANRAVAAA